MHFERKQKQKLREDYEHVTGDFERLHDKQLKSNSKHKNSKWKNMAWNKTRQSN